MNLKVINVKELNIEEDLLKVIFSHNEKNKLLIEGHQLGEDWTILFSQNKTSQHLKSFSYFPRHLMMFIWNRNNLFTVFRLYLMAENEKLFLSELFNKNELHFLVFVLQCVWRVSVCVCVCVYPCPKSAPIQYQVAHGAT